MGWLLCKPPPKYKASLCSSEKSCAGLSVSFFGNAFPPAFTMSGEFSRIGATALAMPGAF